MLETESWEINTQIATNVLNVVLTKFQMPRELDARTDHLLNADAFTQDQLMDTHVFHADQVLLLITPVSSEIL
jgi:hypothetical protein